MYLIYIDNTPGLDIPEKSDEIFGLVVSHPSLPVITGVLFITGLVAAAYSYDEKLHNAACNHILSAISEVAACEIALHHVLIEPVESDGVAAAYSAAGSALVSLTTSFTVDILDGTGMEDTRLAHDKFEAHLIAVGFAESMFYNIAYHRGGYAYDRHHAVVDRAPAEHAEGKQARPLQPLHLANRHHQTLRFAVTRGAQQTVDTFALLQR